MIEREQQVVQRRIPGGVERRRVVESKQTLWDAFLSRLNQLIWLVTGVVTGVILLRVILRLASANASNDFADLIYDVSGALMEPFDGLLASVALEANDAVFEPSAVVAIVVYLLAAFVITSAINILFRTRRGSRWVSVARKRVEE